MFVLGLANDSIWDWSASDWTDAIARVFAGNEGATNFLVLILVPLLVVLFFSWRHARREDAVEKANRARQSEIDRRSRGA